VEVSLMYPLDLVKTRNQLRKDRSLSMYQTLREVVKDKGVFGMYRGIISPWMAEAPKRAWKFSMNEHFKTYFITADKKLSNKGAAGAGALAGMSEVIINCPFEVVKVRMQAKENIGRYKNTLDCVVQLLKQEGLVGLYKGAEPQIWRNAIWNGTYFGIIGSVRNSWKPPADSTHSTQMTYKFMTGCISSAIATTLNTPFDVAKSRMQNQLHGQVAQYNWTIPTLLDIYKNEGFRALYRGFAARMARLVPGGGIMLVAFDVVAAYLEKY